MRIASFAMPESPGVVFRVTFKTARDADFTQAMRDVYSECWDGANAHRLVAMLRVFDFDIQVAAIQVAITRSTSVLRNDGMLKFFAKNADDIVRVLTSPEWGQYRGRLHKRKES